MCVLLMVWSVIGIYFLFGLGFGGFDFIFCIYESFVLFGWMYFN